MAEADEKLMRQYLLGALSEAEMSRFEERLMTDSELFQMVEVIEDELIDERLDNQLSPDERGRFDTYFLSTPARRERLEFAQALRNHVNPLPKPKPVIRPTRWWQSRTFIGLAAAAVILIVIRVFVWPEVSYRRDVRRGMTALNKAYAESPTNTRITGLNYQPPATERGNASGKTANNLALETAKGLLGVAADEHPNELTYHAVGRLFLAERDFDNAIKYLEDAVKLNGRNAESHSDLGAALLERGKDEQTKGEPGKALEDFAQSNEHLSRALELNSSLLEALFNRALCYEYLSLPQKALEDWQRYLDNDSSSPWSRKAEQERRRLLDQTKSNAAQDAERLLADFIRAYQARDDAQAWQALRRGRTRTGNLIVDRLLDSHLDRAVRGQTAEAADFLRMMSYAGEVEWQKVGDRFTKDWAAFYQQALPRQRQALADARRLISTARDRYDHEEYQEAVESYAKAQRRYQQAHDFCGAAAAECWVGIASLRVDAKQSLHVLEPLSQTFEDKSYKRLLGEALSGRADAASSQRLFSQTLELGRRAFSVSEQIEDAGGMLRALQFPVAMYQRFGDYRQSLDHIARAFNLVNEFSPEPYQIWPFYHQMAFNLYSLRCFIVALDFQQEALHLAMQSGLPLLRSRSYARLGLMYENLKDEDAAVKNGELALAEAQTIRGQKSRDNVVANSSLNLAHLYSQRGDMGRAVAYYDQAIQIHNELDIQIYLFEAHKGKLLALIGMNNDRAAEAEMKTAIEVVEQYRLGISEESNRNAFFDLAQSIYDIATDFSHTRLHDDQQALAYAERSRARSLFDMMKATETAGGGHTPSGKRGVPIQPLPITELQRHLPERAQVLEYSVLDDKVLIWLFSKGGEIKYTESRVAASALNEQVRRYLELIRRPDQSTYPEAAGIAKRLYEWLIQPVESCLATQDLLCIVTDKVLGYLPFGALISPDSEHFFVADHCFVLAPSTSIFIAASEQADRKAGARSERLLAVGNPSFDHSRYEDLPDAVKEVEKVARFYGASPLTGDAVRERRVKLEMQRADVIHLATHYIADPQSPTLSKLLLAREPESKAAEDGCLQASEIYDMRLPSTRLVVLSACQTGIERSYKGEGAISIARPFLNAGVPLVVASLWPVETESASRLMVHFHRHRKQDPDVSTAEALRRAQQDMFLSADERYHHPYYWAAFAAIGGHARF